MTVRHITVALVATSLFACVGTTSFHSREPIEIAATPPAPPPAPAPPPELPPTPPPPPPAPPPARVELRDNKIEFAEKIQFEVNKATIKEESFSLLHDIADVITKNPQVKKISIEGHASAEGDAKKNKKLSDDRAKAVMAHLISKENVEAGRLTARGWGVEKPVAPNDDEAGREKNRRVEFLVTAQEVTTKKVQIDPATGKERTVKGSKETKMVETPSAPPAATPSAAPAAPPASSAKPQEKK